MHRITIRRNHCLGSRSPLHRILFALLSLFAGLMAAPLFAQPEIVELRNGMILGPGLTALTDTISTNSNERAGPTGTKSILSLNDGLRKTYVNASIRNIIANRASTGAAVEQIELPSAAEAAKAGGSPSILGVIQVTPFSKYGRRTYSFATTRGRVDVLQGITLLTPDYAKVEVLRTGTEEFVWDQRIATTSIPPDQLRAVLLQAVDLDKSIEWLRIVSFYMQAERFVEAREIMSQALEKFPAELGDRVAILTQLDQQLANQKFEEIKLRRAAGQHQLAKTFLGQFPLNTMSGENQLKLDAEIKSMQQQVLLVTDIVQSLKALVGKLPEPDQQVVSPIVQEIFDEIGLDSVVRLDDFQRLRRDESIPSENLVAYALGGWILGSGAGIDNFAVAKSLLQVRELVKRYLTVPTQAERQAILEELKSQEGAQPQLLIKLLATMQPPLPAPPHNPEDPAGLLRVETSYSDTNRQRYVVQLPPEYDPNRKYPCVLALPGRGDGPELEINWWCGMNVELGSEQFRFGQATRYGYIVVSPDWMTNSQTEYEYTEGEHSRILTCLRDAFRKFSIDTDRVFVSGHFDGATAAWDLAVSHPDLWAGAIMISPGADKYIMNYSDNLSTERRRPDEVPLGTYIVYGDSDGTRTKSLLGAAATRLLVDSVFDCMTVEYIGEGRVRFASELPRIMQWMELSSHRRVRNPQTISMRTMRPGDRFFYWLEAPSILPNLAGNPFQFDPKSYGMFEAKLLDRAANGVIITKMPSPNHAATVWLTPDMVDFDRPVTFSNAGKKTVQQIEPSIEVMLEDVRGRGDRLQVYWQKVAL